MQNIIKKADILIEAVPYIHKFRGKVIAIKYGGSILGDKKIRHGVLEDIVFLSLVGLKPVLVHGGGPNISERMKVEGKKTEFIEGMRVTDEHTLKVVSEELNQLNKIIVKEIGDLKGHVLGVRGEDGLVEVQKKRGEKDLGFVGEVVNIHKNILDRALETGSIIVISPMGIGKDKHVYNVNADEVAAEVAGALSAEKFVLLTNIRGVMRNPEDINSLISTLTISKSEAFIKEHVVQEGMIPKVSACIAALKAGVKKTHIIDARIPHAMLLEIFTDKGVGTEIIRA